MTAREEAERVLQGLPEELMPAAFEALEAVLKGEESDAEQPPVTCIGMFSSGRGDLSARASRDEFEPPSSR